MLQIVIGDAETGQALITDPNVNMVSFTGSTEVGRIVGAEAGRLLKKVSLELGGNNPLIVLDDADLAAAASAGAYSSFQFQGQVCFATGRHIVHRAVADEYVDLLAQKARRLRTGDPYREDVELGPIVNEQQLQRVDCNRAALDRVRRRAARRGRHVRGPLLPAHRFGRRQIGRAGMDGRDLRPRRAGGDVQQRRRGGRAGQLIRVRPRRGRLLAVDFARPRHRQPNSRGHGPRQRPDINDEATIPFGGMGISGNGGRFGAEANLEAFSQWQWVTVRDDAKSFGPIY